MRHIPLLYIGIREGLRAAGTISCFRVIVPLTLYLGTGFKLQVWEQCNRWRKN
jgi:hypothetical protein